MSQIQPGQRAPDFELPDQNGAPVRLSQFRAQSPVVLFFYPKDDTTGCTIEACTFRDEMPRFDSLAAKVIGVSSDSSESHSRFAAKHGLPYTLLSDNGGKVKKMFGVKNTFAFIPGRVTFVIDRDGIVRHVFSSQTQFQKHIEEALRALTQA
ncbi:MAG TPA: peroxiredoxin [Bryobacteraceae bacterium]|nr:peroxiredoxin [Bryobacteraceae bacterium]